MPHDNIDTAEPLHLRKDWIDSVRALACLMVILLHAAAYYVVHMEVQTVDWAWANAIDSATRVCVPLFFMITGYLFLSDRSPKLRHILRVIAAIVVYSGLTISLIWISSGKFPQHLIVSMPYEPVFYHLWYLYAILGIYLLGSIISVRPTVNASTLITLIILMFILNDSGLTPLGSNLALDGSTIIYLLFAASGVVLGQLISTLESNRITIVRHTSFVLFWVFVATIIVLTSQASITKGSFVGTYYNYSHPFVIGAAFSCFTWLRLANPKPIFKAIIRRISEHSLAIYGVHALVLEVVRRVASRIDQPALIEITLSFVVVVILSYAIARGLRLLDRNKIFT